MIVSRNRNEMIPKRLRDEVPSNLLLELRNRRNVTLRRKISLILTMSCCYVAVMFSGSESLGAWFSSDPERYSLNQLRRNAQTTEFTGEPSHIRMCRHLLPRFEHALAIDSAEKKAEALGLRGLNLANIPELQIPEKIDMDYLLVEEDEHVCQTSSTPSDSLLQIFSSTLLSAAAARFNLNVEYHHNCRQWRKLEKHEEKNEEGKVGKEKKKEEAPLTIQEMLPEDLLDNDQTSKIPLEVLAIKNICFGCLAEFEANNGTVSSRNCALFTRPTVYTPLSIYGKKKRRQRIKRGKYDRPRSPAIKAMFNSMSRIDEEAEEENTEEEDEDTASTSTSRRTSDDKKGAQLPTGIVSILPVLKSNLQAVGEVWTESITNGNAGGALTDKLKTRPGSLAGPSQKHTETVSVASLGEEGAYSKVSADEAVIYLTCKKESCATKDFTDALVMPFYVYATEIPSNVAEISVIVSMECKTYVEDCVPHGQALHGFLTKFYPRAKVSFIIEASTYAAFAQMVTADYVLCPPGLGCMLPSLATNGHSTQISNPNLVFWLPQLSVENIWNMKFLPMNQVPVMSVKGLDFSTFLQKIPPGKIGQCRHLRGRHGHWEQDLALAPSMQYVTPIRHYVGEADMKFEPSDALPFRTASTFKWEETIFPTCGPQLMTLEGLCFAMAEIDMDRIFIIGDSSSMNQAQSLWKLLGNDDNPNVLGVRDPNWDRVIDCPEEDRTITISYSRNDQLIENDKPVDIEKDLRNCYAYCYPWVERYTDFEGSTMVLVNTGAHYQTHHQFQYALREFVKKLDSLNRVWDIMLYRTSTPGHRDCQDRPTAPFASYEEYAPTVTDEYSWDKFVGYNDYAVQLIENRQRESSRGLNPTATTDAADALLLPKPDRIKIEILDVYPMTVLRQDGHVSGEDCEGCQSREIRDCMHYFLPGPLDWWNHALYSHIMDLGRRE